MTIANVRVNTGPQGGSAELAAKRADGPFRLHRWSGRRSEAVSESALREPRDAVGSEYSAPSVATTERGTWPTGHGRQDRSAEHG